MEWPIENGLCVNSQFIKQIWFEQVIMQLVCD